MKNQNIYNKLNNRYLMYSILFFCSLLLTNCKERIDLELGGSEVRLVVDGKINTDSAIQKVKLTKSADYFDNKPVEPITNAMVSINDGTSTIVLKENSSKPGVYETAVPMRGIPGKTYVLNISNANVGNGVTEYTATSFLPLFSKLDTFVVSKLPKGAFAPPGSKYAIKAKFSDPAQSQDNYVFRVYKNSVQLTDTFIRISYTTDEFFNGRTIDTSANMIYFIMFDYKLGRGSGVIVTDTIVKGDRIVLEMEGVTNEYVTFINQMQDQYRGSNPLFGGPPANPTTNIYPREKSFGFFTAINIDRDTLIFK